MTTHLAWLLISFQCAATLQGEVGQPSERVLPLRNEALIAKLQTVTEPVLQEVSLSPDGATVLYVETVLPPQIGNGFLKGSDNPETLWLQHLATGRRVVLKRNLPRLDAWRMGDVLRPQWSPDGQQVAFLEQSEHVRTLVVFRTGAPESPTRVLLPALSATDQGDASIADWIWHPASAEVTLILGSKENDRASAEAGANKPAPVFALVWSRDGFLPMKAKEQSQSSLSRRLGTPQRIVIANLKTRKVREIIPRTPLDGVPIPVISRSPFYRSWTVIADRRHLLLRTLDPRVDTADNNRLMRLLETNDPQGHEFSNAHSQVYELDLETGRVERRYSGGPGLIAAAIQDRKANALIVLEATPATGTWPMATLWGELRSVAGAAHERTTAGSPVPLEAKLFASDRAGVIYHTDAPKGRWSVARTHSELYETDVVSGRQTLLTPPGMAATSRDVSLDGRTIVAVLENKFTPPAVYMWTRARPRWREIARHRAVRIDLGAGTVERFSWRSKDNVFDAEGFVVKPPNFDSGKRYPLVVALVGGNSTGTSPIDNIYDPLVGSEATGGMPAVLFSAAGYVVFVPNHRGMLYSPFAATRALIGHYGQQVPLDVEAGVDALIAKGWVDPTKLAIIGHSNGSSEATYAITHTTRYKAAVINDGPNALPEYVLLSAYAADEGRHRLKTPERMTALYGFDPVRQPPWADPFQIRTPLLLRWSQQREEWDANVLQAGLTALRPDIDGNTMNSVGQMFKFYYALQQNQIPIDIILDRDGHGIANMTYLIEFNSRLLQWFDYFVLNQGENPIPAMKSPLDYTEALQALRKKSEQR